MNSEISSVAKSRARYYCKGAPVQFVQVELLRINENNNMIVTLTFKNIAPQMLTGFTAHFRCKGMEGATVIEDNFTYTDLSVAEGELFGGDDAVFVSEEPLSSVEVSLVQVEYGPNLRHNLQRCQPVPLPQLKQLSVPTAQAVNVALQADSVRYLPANVADGWQCSCGAFNYNIGTSKGMCTECGLIKAPLLGAVRAALQSEADGTLVPVRKVAPQNEPKQRLPGMIDWDGAESAPQMNGYDSMGDMGYDAPDDFGGMEEAIPAHAGVGDTAQYDRFNGYDAAGHGDSAYDKTSKTAVISTQRGRDSVVLMQTETADFVMKFAPLITLGAAAIYVGALLLINLLA